MSIALCTIGRMENEYANEFVYHYKNLGFDKIFIYDNNHDEEEHFEDVLKDDINRGFVEIVNYRNKEKAQFSAYNDCYAKHGKEYDWIAFFDMDEFLVLNCSLDDFLIGKDAYQCIVINWMIMTDNNLVHNDHRPMMERFTEPMPFDKPIQYQFPDNCHIKSIVKGGLNSICFAGNPHIPSTPLICCNANGVRCDSSPFQQIDYTTAYLKHFTTKTIEEWMTRKMKVGTPDRQYSTFISMYKDRFFKVNKITNEKLDYLKSINAI